MSIEPEIIWEEIPTKKLLSVLSKARSITAAGLEWTVTVKEGRPAYIIFDRVDESKAEGPLELLSRQTGTIEGMVCQVNKDDPEHFRVDGHLILGYSFRTA